jgi:hypothetical protein
VAIEPGSIRLHIHLTPGVAVAGQVLALADRNHDGMISAEEAEAYAELLQHDLRVRLDRQRVQFNPLGFDKKTKRWGQENTESAKISAD